MPTQALLHPIGSQQRSCSGGQLSKHVNSFQNVYLLCSHIIEPFGSTPICTCVLAGKSPRVLEGDTVAENSSKP